MNHVKLNLGKADQYILASKAEIIKKLTVLLMKYINKAIITLTLSVSIQLTFVHHLITIYLDAGQNKLIYLLNEYSFHNIIKY